MGDEDDNDIQKPPPIMLHRVEAYLHHDAIRARDKNGDTVKEILIRTSYDSPSSKAELEAADAEAVAEACAKLGVDGYIVIRRSPVKLPKPLVIVVEDSVVSLSSSSHADSSSSSPTKSSQGELEP